MTYQTGGLIQASDFNNLIGTSGTPSSSATLNKVWSTGTRDFGYGQSPISEVSANTLVESENWASLINTINAVATHQGQSLSPTITPPIDNEKIAYLQSVVHGLSQIQNNRHYALAQASTQTSTQRYTTSNWSDRITFTFILTFASGDSARYFFNAGGQIAINFSHLSTTTRADMLFNQLTNAIGTLVLSAPSGSKTAVIAGTQYTGFSRIGGTGMASVFNSGNGFYSLGTSDKLLFDMSPVMSGLVSDIHSQYAGTKIQVYAKTNGTQGTNGDIGSVLTVTCVWDQDPNSFNISNGNNTGPVNNSTTTLTVRYPKSTASGGVLVNTWGTVNVQSSVFGN